ncbi:DoxX family protein [Pseudonocardia bannensis]|uniref:DoxX family protein n=1 Tax=Pseudonocardia bannensis TaxID=630973 RepID=A0A848DCV0_9PSEU|nr:DoxX family protein [Pseudonocardia bannensis]NMH90420.1 DoxX family protein [Pseudonocardia bannensis]
MSRSLPGSARDVALLAARLVLGAVLIAHGWQKLATNGIAATTEAFAGVGVPLAPLAAIVATLVELVGGVLLVVGAATAVAGILVVLTMLGAALLVHAGNGIFAADGGWELVGVIAVTALVLAATGAGRFSVDHALASRGAKAQVEPSRSAA